ncbi:hypothetical protein ME9_01595 [Bartonella taylorii 8TBB]|uniref:Uncharacterized protein n=1 Tax=Bartonella taylorii 8TBB TaxID=1094560 RepID=A0A9P2W272_BARTA|nr:hypothetical protein ME9_01595 [Bartonella taylorii 8TBB]OPB35372.1 hypothetical protein Btaycd_005430 [Bartonella taylorii]
MYIPHAEMLETFEKADKGEDIFHAEINGDYATY